MSKNKHNCTCNHENVSYCKTCRVCHCADCNQEWTAKGSGYNPYYWGQGLQTTYTTNTPTLTSKQLENLNLYKTTPTTLTEPLTSTVTCGHTK